ncbi:MAG: flotillin family protein, partial [Brachybacterium sp.]
ETFAKGYAQIGDITVISSGSNDGDVAGKQFAGESVGALRGVFDSVESTLGLSIPDLIQGRAVGAAQGEALGAALREPTADGAAPKRSAATSGSGTAESGRATTQTRESTSSEGEASPQE